MSGGRRSDDFHLSGLKTSMSGPSTSSSRAGDVLQAQFSQNEAQAKESQYTLLQLISMVRENPILYDEETQAGIPDSQLKKQKKDAWVRIRADMMWQDMTPVQDVWSELLEQYARKADDMSDSIFEAMRWTDTLLSKKKSDSRPPSQLNASLEKDFFADVPLGEDVLVSGQSMGSPSSSLNIIRDYVVITPTRRIGEMDGSAAGSSSNQYSRRKSPEPRETEAIVRTYPLGTKRPGMHPRVEEPNHKKQMLTEMKKVDPMYDHYNMQKRKNYGRNDVIVEVEQGYTTPTQKMYKMVSPQRTTPPQATATVTSGRRLLGVFQMPRDSHSHNQMTYDPIPPEQLLEAPEIPPEIPVKKKMHMDSHHRSVSLVGPSPSTITMIPAKNRVNNLATVLLSGQQLPDKILSDVIPIANDEIILEADGEIRECKPYTGAQNLMGPRGTEHPDLSDPSTSSDQMHHYHHSDMEMNSDDGGIVQELGPEVDVEGPHDDLITIQYDEDLAFQQHINVVLNRLSDDDKAVMKFNMQKIILDAKFGAGTARNMLKCDEMLDVNSHEEVLDDSSQNEPL